LGSTPPKHRLGRRPGSSSARGTDRTIEGVTDLLVGAELDGYTVDDRVTRQYVNAGVQLPDHGIAESRCGEGGMVHHM
jgi:hypothetical protein